jgi:uncharacterized membrane protein YagU involved in acid resistance
MSSASPPSPFSAKVRLAASGWRGALAAALVGAAGGTLGATLAGANPGAYAAAGAGFGLVGAARLSGRTQNAGAGLIWGLGCGFLLWVAIISASAAAHLSGASAQAMIGDVRLRIPEFIACVLCIGAPVGITLGIRGGMGPNAVSLHWGRALVAGGSSGFAAALIFSRWMYEGDFFPLIAGFVDQGSHFTSVLLHLAVACVIGCTFGVLFQNDVRNLGSSMGWGMAYAIFWWLLGPMTLFPLASGQRPDWTSSHAGELFGPLVGYVFYGLILGVVHSAANTVWTRLFVDSDPLNRKREGPGIHVLLSLGWGATAGLVGGLVALPLMIQTAVVMKLAGLADGTPLALGVLLHLVASTVIGASYGFLFRGEATDGVSCSLWGCVLGMIAWYVGPLTLLPLLRTGQCDWRPEAAAALLPLLVSHLLFGMVTANVFSAFERSRLRRDTPIAHAPLGDIGGEPGSRPTAPLCLFVLGMGVILPILLV